MAEGVRKGALIVRDTCVMCGGKSLEPIVAVRNAPVYQGCVESGTEPTLADMDWHGCPICGAAQIVSMPPLDLVYQSGHATGLGDVWLRHHEAFARFIQENMTGARVLEIGGGVGQLATAVRSIGVATPWTILEPNPVTTRSAPDDVAYMIGFIESGFVDASKSDVFVMSHVVEHFYFPAEVVTALAAALTAGGEMFVAWPVLEEWCDRLVPGALNFEHNYFASRAAVVRLFEAQGLRLEVEERFGPLATTFLLFRKKDKAALAPERVEDAHDSRVVELYFRRLQVLSRAVNASVEEQGGTAFMTPASVYSQTLLTLGLRPDGFTALLDNSPSKQGRALYGVSLPILDPKRALPDTKRPVVVLNAGAHNDEIRRQYVILNPEARFIDVREIGGAIDRS